MFPSRDITRNGLRIRDAWRQVFERQPVCSVLCADENNVYTRLLALLASRRGIRTVYCAHGELDVNVLIRGICSDTYLVKGEMERDYLVRQCEVPPERIIIGAAAGRGAPLNTEFLYQTTSFFCGHPDREYVIVDSDPMKKGKSWRGIEIHSPDVLRDVSSSTERLLVSSYTSRPSIVSAAKELGFPPDRIWTLYDELRVY